MSKKPKTAKTETRRPVGPTTLLRRIRRARQTAERIIESLKETAPLLEQATVLLLGQKVFDVAREEKPDREKLAALSALWLKFKQQALAERKLALLGRGAPQEQTKQSAASQAGGVSPETLKQIEELATLL